MNFLDTVEVALEGFNLEVYQKVHDLLMADVDYRPKLQSEVIQEIRFLQQNMAERVDPKYAEYLRFTPTELDDYIDSRTKLQLLLRSESAVHANDIQDPTKRICASFIEKVNQLYSATSISPSSLPYELKRLLAAVYMSDLTVKDIYQADIQRKVTAAGLSANVALLILYAILVRSPRNHPFMEKISIMMALFDSCVTQKGTPAGKEAYHWAAMGIQTLLAWPKTRNDGTLEMIVGGVKQMEIQSITAKSLKEGCQLAARKIEANTGLTPVNLLSYVQLSAPDRLVKDMPLMINAFMHWDETLELDGALTGVLATVYRDYATGNKTRTAIDVNDVTQEAGFALYDDGVLTHYDKATGHPWAALWLLNKVTVFLSKGGTGQVDQFIIPCNSSVHEVSSELKAAAKAARCVLTMKLVGVAPSVQAIFFNNDGAVAGF